MFFDNVVFAGVLTVSLMVLFFCRVWNFYLERREKA